MKINKVNKKIQKILLGQGKTYLYNTFRTHCRDIAYRDPIFHSRSEKIGLLASN